MSALPCWQQLSQGPLVRKAIDWAAPRQGRKERGCAMMKFAGGAASYGPKSALVLDEPVEKHGSEVADRSVMTPAEERSDLD